MRKLWITLLILSMCLVFVGCGAKYDGIKIADNGNLIYQGNEYCYNTMFGVAEQTIPNERDIKIGEHLLFGDFFSYTENEPIYVYCKPKSVSLYIRKDYDYKSDVFVLDVTDESFVMSDILAEKLEYKYSYLNNYDREISVILKSQTYPHLKTSTVVFCENDVWYISFVWNEFETYKVSQAFSKLFVTNE